MLGALNPIFLPQNWGPGGGSAGMPQRYANLIEWVGSEEVKRVNGQLGQSQFEQRRSRSPWSIGPSFAISLIISLGVGTTALAQTPIAPMTLEPANPGETRSLIPVDPLMRSIPNVAALSDVQPTDWAYQYVKTLNERYNLLIGDPDGKFRGNEPLTRNEFAAVLAQVLQRVEIFRDQEREELNALQRLLDSYRAAIGDLRIRLSGTQGEVGVRGGLEERTDRLEQQVVSPTTKLQTQIVQTLTAGNGANPTGLSRVRLNLRTSFSGRDQLTTQLEFGNNGGDAIGLAQQNQGNALGTTSELVDGGGLTEVGTPAAGRLRKLYYEFPIGKTLRLAVGSNLPPSDFIDRNRFANPSGANFGSSFFVNNPLIVQNSIDRFGGAGVAADWVITDRLRLRGVYAAANADTPKPQGGLFGDRYQATLETEYQPNKNVALRLQYTNAKVNGVAINAVGLNAEWAVRRELALFGRVGFGRYTGFNSQRLEQLDLNPTTWMAGATLRNLLVTGSKAGIAIGQPFVESGFGTATQTNTEAYFSFLLNDKINLIPSVQIVSNPSNQEGKTIWQWAFRAVVDF
jgi:Carbohydrate-selective porin, OprB family/S-layer homology domain